MSRNYQIIRKFTVLLIFVPLNNIFCCFITEEYLHIKSFWEFVLGDVVAAFKTPNILDQALVIVPISLKGEEEIAADFGGAMRDIFSAFWGEFNK